MYKYPREIVGIIVSNQQILACEPLYCRGTGQEKGVMLLYQYYTLLGE